MEENNEIIRLDVVNSVKKNLIDDEEIFDLAELFKVFADSTRMKIINSLIEKELCVGEIAYITNTSTSGFWAKRCELVCVFGGSCRALFCGLSA